MGALFDTQVINEVLPVGAAPTASVGPHVIIGSELRLFVAPQIGNKYW